MQPPGEQEHSHGLSGARVFAIVGAIVVLVVLLDQLVKVLAVGWIGPEQDVHRWEIAGSLLAFEYVENTGAAFGILAGRIWLLSVLALIVALGFLLAFRKELPVSGPLRLSIGLVTGGGIGNLIDRLRFGYVIDYLAVGIWPKFNVADAAITIGLVLLALTALREEPARENTT